MAEYIERQKVFDSLPIVTEDKKISLYGAVADFMVLVSAIPAADVVEVVRCKDCKRMAEKYGMYVCNHALPTKSLNQYIEMGTDILAIVQPYDFCSYGERRSDG